MTDLRKALDRGLWWLGTATLLTRVVDVATIFLVLRMLDRREVGLAALVASITMLMEAVQGLGLSQAMVQARRLTRRHLDSAASLCVLLGVLAVLLLWVMAPWLGQFYGDRRLGSLLNASAVKLLLLHLAIVPLVRLQRGLRFRAIGMIQTSASLTEAALKVVLLSCGVGVWALVLAALGRATVMLAMALTLAHWRPRWRLEGALLRPLLRFGVRTSGAQAVHQLQRSLDGFLIGRWMGLETLGIYRVAVDATMTPMDTVLSFTQRVAYPVLARAASRPVEVCKAFYRSSHDVLRLSMPWLLAEFLFADDLLRWLGGAEWGSAAPAVRWLCWAALLRGLLQVFPSLLDAIGRPQLSLRNAIVNLVLSGAALSAALTLGSPRFGILAVCVAWVGCYPLLLLVAMKVTRSVLQVRWYDYLQELSPSLMFLAVAAPLATLGLSLAERFSGAWRSVAEAAIGASLLVAYLALVGAKRLLRNAKMRWARASQVSSAAEP